MVAPFVEHFDVVVYDQRGLGASGKPPGPYEMADYAADAAGLLDHLGWERSRVVGISFGGMVAQELAVTWPARVERLALVCTSPGGPDASSYPLHSLEELPVEERAAADDRAARHPVHTRVARHASRRPRARGARPRATTAPSTPRRGAGCRSSSLARSRLDVIARLGRISCPTLVACGRYDGIAPPANAAVIAEHVAQAEVRPYDGGHMFFVQDPQALPDIIDFLRR